MKQYELSLDPRLAQKLDVFRTFPAHDPQTAAQGRANFLSMAQSISQGVPEGEIQSIWAQVNPLTAFLRLFERLPSPALFASALILFVLLLASVATVFAAQGSLPGQPLYGVKTLSEETRLALSSDPEAKINLALEFAGRRITELPTAAQIGTPQLDATLARFQQQLNLALQVAASLDEDQIIPALQRIRLKL